MDTPSHGLWSYVLFSRTPFALYALIIGVLPDILPFIPSVLHNWSQGKLIGKLRVKEMPAYLRHYVHNVFHFTHSLITASVVSVIILLFWHGQWWILAWPIHVFVDIFTHRKEEPTPFLWPISGYGYGGNHWTLQYFIVSTVLLVITFILLHI
jgi:membrane-bound metal-dependent hydrolase YbcI (DUF457 family)